MKKIAITAQATLFTTFTKGLKRAAFLGGLKVPACYPESKGSIHLH